MQVQCQILSESEKQDIHEKSLRIIEEIGVMSHSKKARQILKQHGAGLCARVLHAGRQVAGEKLQAACITQWVCAG
jgi:trimethylamine:corrinoid methyltransferase-like protein